MLLSAQKIHNGKQWLPEQSTIEISEHGTIIAIHTGILPGTEVYDGILCPGFVNAHCHLELSHMRGVIAEKTGLIPFLQSVFFHRGNHNEEQRKEARHLAYDEMLKNGIVAVGDIANMPETMDLRERDEMHVHTFIESIGFTETPQKQFGQSVNIFDAFASQKNKSKRLSQSIVPHAPYSVSQQLFSLIDKHDEGSIISIHNQESPAEDEYYLLKEGGVKTLLESIGIDTGFFHPSGKSSIQTYLQWLSASHPVIFVHNTYTKKADIEVATTLLPEVYWCLCPNANLYIENQLPDIPMFIEKGVNICVGTDSLSSNHQLCVLSELYTIKQTFPAIQWETLLQWGTHNGACALRMNDIIGSIAPGLQPGILNIQGIDGGGKPTVKRVI